MKPCDITKVEVLLRLFEVPPAKRDQKWVDRFFANVINASFRCDTPQVFTGPDGFPYFSLLSPEPNKSFESFCLCNLAEPATTDGFGVTINRRGDGVDWVFSCGDLLTLRLTGQLRVEDKPNAKKGAEKVSVSAGEQVLTGAPSESYLPSYTRVLLRHFMQHSLNVKHPKVFLMIRPADPEPQQLVFSVFPEEFRSEQEFFNVQRMMSWFLPRHYGITGISKSSDLCDAFVAL